MDNSIVESKMILSSIESFVTDILKDYSGDFVRRKKMLVAQGVHTDENGNSVLSVQEAFGEPFEVPFVPELYNAQVGDSVWVEWAYGLGNACAVNSGSWKQSFISANENGVSLILDELQATHIGGDVINIQGAKSVTVNGKIQDAIDGLGKHLTGDVSIAVPAGTYVEDVNISGFDGAGTLTMTLDKQAIVKGDWVIAGNKRVIIEGSTDGTNTTQFVGSIEDSVMELRGDGYVKVSGAEIHGVERAAGEDGQAYGIYVRDGSYAYITDCLIDRTGAAVYVEHAHLDIADCKGGEYSTAETSLANLVNGVIISEDGGYVNAKGTIPAGTDSTGTGYEANEYPFTCSGTVTQKPTNEEGEQPAPPPPEITDVTSTWTSSAGYYCESYKTGTDAYDGRGTGWRGDGTYSLRMGYNTSSKKYMAGLWIFSDAATIAQTLSRMTIKKATVSLKRTSANGSSSGAVVKPYYHNLTTLNLSQYVGRNDPWGISQDSGDKYVDCGCTAQYIELGQTGTFELPA